MPHRANTHLIEKIATHIRSTRERDVSLEDVMSLAELTVDIMQTYREETDRAAYQEFRAISAFIASAREEIANLQANDISTARIPEAGGELDAVIKATEDATNTIMESAEKIMDADPDDREAYQACVNDAVVRIFEACSFQDITGQRISKVVATLKHIDERITRFVDAFGVEDAQGAMSAEEEAEARRREELILHGPQMAGEGVAQDDVDAMMNSDAPGSRAKASQDDIDSLF